MFCSVCFYCMPSWGLFKHIETKLQTTFTHIRLFNKIKSDLGLVSLPNFPHNFWRKIFLLLCFISWPRLVVWLPLLREILVNMCIVFVNQVATSWILQLILSFWSRRFSCMTKKSWQKLILSWKWKELLRWKEKHFSSFLKGFQWSK